MRDVFYLRIHEFRDGKAGRIDLWCYRKNAVPPNKELVFGIAAWSGEKEREAAEQIVEQFGDRVNLSEETLQMIARKRM